MGFFVFVLAHEQAITACQEGAPGAACVFCQNATDDVREAVLMPIWKMPAKASRGHESENYTVLLLSHSSVPI